MTEPIIQNQQITGEEYLEIWLQTFLEDRKSQNLKAGTIQFYRYNLQIFLKWLHDRSIRYLAQLNPGVIRDFIRFMEESHNPGGVHVFYRCIKAWLKFIEFELEDEDWINPIHKVKPPRVPEPDLPEVTREQFDTLIAACNNPRDAAILHLLYDTGARAMELCNLKISNLSLVNKSIYIEKGKGDKPRIVGFGRVTARKLRRYLKVRNSNSPYLFLNDEGEKLGYVALREILRRLLVRTGTTGISLHCFRRSFTSESLRKNVDVVSLSRLLGHTSVVLLTKYAKQKDIDLMNKYKSPIDED